MRRLFLLVGLGIGATGAVVGAVLGVATATVLDRSHALPLPRGRVHGLRGAVLGRAQGGGTGPRRSPGSRPRSRPGCRRGWWRSATRPRGCAMSERSMVRCGRRGKGYGGGPTPGRGAARASTSRSRRGAGGGRRAVRGGQEHAAPPDRPARPAGRRDGSSSTGSTSGGCRRGDRARVRNRTIGFVFQHHYLLDELDARDNVALPLRIAGQRSAAARSRAAELLAAVGLSERAAATSRTSSPEGSSSGWRSPARWPCGPACCSPTSRPGTSTGTTPSRCSSWCGTLHLLEGLTSIIVTHNEELARRCDRVFRLAPAGKRCDVRDDSTSTLVGACSSPATRRAGRRAARSGPSTSCSACCARPTRRCPSCS